MLFRVIFDIDIFDFIRSWYVFYKKKIRENINSGRITVNRVNVNRLSRIKNHLKQFLFSTYSPTCPRNYELFFDITCHFS